MGLIRRNEYVSPASRLYVLPGQGGKILIVGLGNPGKEYEKTRHNAGFMAIDSLADEIGVGWSQKKDLKAFVAATSLGGKDIILVKPTTFMNESGQAVRAVMDFYKVAPGDVLVVHDELDLDFGTTRLKKGGGAAGHNGIKSIIQHIGEDFVRVRIGVGPKTPEQIDSADFVLQDFSKTEQKSLGAIFARAIQLLKDTISE